MSDYPQDDSFVERAWDAVGNLRTRLRPTLRLYKNELFLGGFITSALALSLFAASDVFHAHEKPFIGNQPMHPKMGFQVPPGRHTPFDPKYDATVQDPPYAQEIAACWGRKVSDIDPGGVYMDPSAAVTFLKTCEHLNRARTPGATPESIREAARAQMRTLGLDPDSGEAAAGAILGSLGTGQRQGVDDGLPIDGGVQPSPEGPIPPVGQNSIDYDKFGQKNQQTQPQQQPH